MKRILLFGTVISLFLTSCNFDDPYKVTATTVGPLTQQTTIDELETTFKKDSVVDNQASSQSLDPRAKVIAIYEKGGDQLLSLKPKQDGKTIESIQIFDARYTTSEGINLNSTFSDIQEAYSISKIQTLLSSIIIFVDEINAYFTIDKKELPSALQFDPSVKVEASQIPDDAKIKYFMMGW